MEQTQ
jgi:hypothetical protein